MFSLSFFSRKRTDLDKASLSSHQQEGGADIARLDKLIAQKRYSSICKAIALAAARQERKNLNSHK